MISLRLSEAEYEALRAHYSIHGARNVSDLARLALQRIIGASPAMDAELAAKLHELNDRMNAMEGRMAVLLEREKVTS